MSVFENFISYRRKETSSEVQALYSELTRRGYLTFCDIHSLRAGNFEEELTSTIASCTNFILVLGPNSLDRCNEPSDWLRMEIREACKEKKNIICVFVGDFAFPNSLPPDISEIRKLNGIRFDFIYFISFVDRLVDRFLVSKNAISITNPHRDFIINGNELQKYVGRAPTVIIPEHVRIIAANAFKDKTFITSVTFSGQVEEIHECAFERCIKLTNVSFPRSLKIIGRRAFYRCYNLAYVSLNDELEFIEDEAFGHCSKIKLIQLGDAIHHISSSAFNGCVQLINFLVSENNQHFSDIEGILYNKEQTTLIRCGQNYNNDIILIPDTVTRIAPWAFFQCLSVVNISLPSGLQTIEEYAFKDCAKIQSLTLGSKISTFALSAIDGWSPRQNIITGKDFNPALAFQIKRMLHTKVPPKPSSKDEQFILVKATFEAEEEALNMAKMLSLNRLIGCAQIYPINTFYMWDGQVCSEREFEMSCITRQLLYSSVEKFIMMRHSYNLCQIIAVPIIHSSASFGNWIEQLTD